MYLEFHFRTFKEAEKFIRLAYWSRQGSVKKRPAAAFSAARSSAFCNAKRRSAQTPARAAAFSDS